MLIRFILLPFLIFTSFAASAALTTVPLREVWALSVDDSVVINQATKTAVGRVMLPNAEGFLFRATATTTSARVLGVAESALTGGKGNPWLTAAILGAGLSYEGYQWYKNYDTEGFEYFGACDAYPSERITLSDCVTRASQYVSTMYNTNPRTSAPIHYQVSSASNKKDSSCTSGKCSIVDGEAVSYRIRVNYQYPVFSIPDGITLVTDWQTNSMGFSFYVKEKRTITKKEKEPITDDVAQSELMSQLSGASSRQAFGENSQPYPLEGLFTNEDLAVDPTYSPSADLNTETLPDYITKYNNGLLQTTDPSKPNYVTPAQYNYIKSQAEKAAANAAGGSTSTNPLEGMEQPITQKQYDESNAKTDEAAANQIKSTDWTGVDTASKGGDGANEALDKMAKGIDPTLPILLAPDFPTYSSCRTIDLTWKGYPAVFPTQSQCVKMEEFKVNFGYFLYLLTAVGIIFELLRRVE